MGCAAVTVAFVVLAVALSLTRVVLQRRALAGALRAVAKGVEGARDITSSVLGGRALELRGRTHGLELLIRCEGPRVSVEVEVPTPFRAVIEPAGGQAGFAVRGGDAARRWSERPEVASALSHLLRLRLPDVLVAGNRIRLDLSPLATEDLEPALAAVVGLARTLQGPQVRVSKRARAAVTAGSAGRCPFCRDPLGDPAGVAACEACRTPHHRECLEEVGRCTVLACAGGRRAPTVIARARP